VATAGFSAARVLTVTTATAAVAQAATAGFDVVDVKTPSSPVGALTDVALKTTDPADGDIADAGATTLTVVTKATLGGTITWDGATDTPGIKSTHTLSFTANGEIPIGGMIILTLPATADLVPSTVLRTYSMLGTPALTVTAGGFALATGGGNVPTFTTLTRVLTVKTATAAVTQISAVAFTVAAVKTPSSEVGSLTNVALKTLDAAAGGIVADCAAVTTTAIAKATIVTGGGLSWTSTTLTPGMKSLHTLTFDAVGEIPTAGLIILTLPQKSAWTPAPYAEYDMDATPTTVAFTGAAVGSGAAGAYATRVLTITTADADITEAMTVVATVTDVKTPSSVVIALTNVALEVRDKVSGGLIADCTAVTTSAIGKGAITVGGVAAATATPGFKSIHTLTFTNVGEIPNTGTIKLTLPTTAAYTPNPKTTFVVDAGATVAVTGNTVGMTGSYAAPALTSTLDTSPGSATTLAETASIVMTVTNIKTPSSEVAAKTVAALLTSDGVGDISEMTTVATEQIAKGALSTAAFVGTTKTPGFKSDHTLTFTNAGEIQIGGGTIVMTLPNAAGLTPSPTTATVLETAAGSFTSPAGSALTALTPAWSAPTVTTTLGAGGSSIPQATAGIAMKLTNVRTPSSVVAAATGTTVQTTDGVGLCDELTTVATDQVVSGDLGSATKTFVSSTKTPGFLSAHTLNIKTAGHVEAGGFIVLRFPDLTAGTQTGWNFETPLVSFTAPTGPAGTAAFVGRVLTITTATATMAQSTQHAIKITNVRTPSSIVAAGVVSDGAGTPAGVSTQDAAAKSIDESVLVATDQIVKGTIAAGTFASATDTAGYSSTATMTFTTIGQVQAGGKIVLTVPNLNAGTGVQKGWNFETPVISFTSGGTGAGAASPVFATRALTLTTSGLLNQAQAHVFTITNVRTPSSETAATTSLQMLLQDSKDKDIDSAANHATDLIGKGQLGGTQTFQTATDTPGVEQLATVVFTTVGQIEIGGKIEITLPTVYASTATAGWRMKTALPAVAFTANAGSAAAANSGKGAWVSGTRVLTITTATGVIVQDTANLKFTIAEVRTPSSFTTAALAAYKTMDSVDKGIDDPAAGNGLDTDQINQGALIGTPGLATATDNPGIQVVATVVFTTAGQVLGATGGTAGDIVLEFPSLGSGSPLQQGWRFLAPANAPTVAFTAPAAPAGTASFVSNDRKLSIRVGTADIADGASVSFTLTKIMTPSGVTGIGVIRAWTKDRNGRITDGDGSNGNTVGASMATEAMTAGALDVSSGKWDAATKTPGVTSITTVTFSTAGQVLSGGKIQIILPDTNDGTTGTPDEEWRIKDGIGGCGAIAFTAPTSPGTPSGYCSWTSSSRTLIVTTGTADIGDGTAAIPVSFTVGTVKTPSSIVAATQTAATTTKDSYSNVVDGPNNINIDPVTVGTVQSHSIAGGILWETALDTPGVLNVVTISFKATGEIKSGFHILIELPANLNFEIPAVVAPRFAEPRNAAGAEYVSATGAYGGTSTRQLKITTGGGDIAEGTNVKMTICHIRSPPIVTAGGTTMTIATGDNVASEAGVTDQATAMTFDAITAGTFLLSAGWGGDYLRLGGNQAQLLNPGVGFAPYVYFANRGQIKAGGKIKITFPTGWTLPTAPAIAFGALTGFTAIAAGNVGAWDSSTRILTITTATAAIPEQTNLRITIGTAADTFTPASVAAATTAAITTLHTDDAVIDGGRVSDTLAVDAVTAGVPTGTLVVTTGADHPGYTQSVTFDFTTVGKLAIGGKIKLTLPTAAAMATAGGWNFASPTVSITGLATLTATAAWSSPTLTLTTAVVDIPAGTALSLTITGAKTPSGITGVTAGTITTTLTGNEVVDSGAMKTEAIVQGTLAGAQWAPNDVTPGASGVSTTVSFWTNGEIPIGGNIIISLPDDGWSFSGNPAVSFVKPSGVTATAQWDGLLGVTVTTANAAIPFESKVQLTLTNVVNPAYDTLENQGTIATYDSAAASARRLIDASTITTVQVFNGASPMLSGASYGAYCPNGCSRHGVCRNFGKCTCYTRPGSTDPAWTQHDCSVRTCPKHKAWVDVANGNSVAHSATKTVECAGKGLCDRKSGQCACFDGYTGIACERQACPKNCNGRGRCVTQEILAYEASKTYQAPWDASMAQGCVCDIGARGPDCSLEECPTGADVLLGEGNNFGRDCSGRGMCDYSTGLCKCFMGYFGTRCQSQTVFS